MSRLTLKQKLRRIRLKLGKLLLDKKVVSNTLEATPKKILFLRQDGKIGDYIVSSFVFREIKKQAPETQIGVVCSRNNAYLFEHSPYIDQLYFVRTKNIGDYLACGKQLAKEQYDVVIDPTVTLRNRDLLFLRTINAKTYIGYDKSDYKLFTLNVQNEQQHFAEIYKQALELAGFTNIDIQYDIPRDEKSVKAVQDYLSENQLEHFITLNLFGAGSARRFSDEKIMELLAYLRRVSIKPILLLTFPEVTPKLKQIAAQLENVFVYENTQTVFDTIELIYHSDILISPDTSTVHIASGLSKKIIGFYSSDEQNFIHWHPNNKAETYVLHFKQSVNDLDFNQIKPEWLN
ncbi:glycosyltransferase family 9 protein [Actinobacillus equuli subsp. equuli]|uniref:Glycosyltransferase family 9 protein n=1 Tax=Actinobacillus equuli subsp. equuli TaxID=202947 RepID=A0A9X4JCB4_ACTEU|nr:glycosyltransferase family 9 protein [Actinobacillus equuli]MDE8034811.1 glycosyltransferase family 9 protein [Actinobacillus equuli subsp. equuli]MDG4948977.1 glycosyltransferase family 9 protein [Actinobacillus equuli subsp. haemolyticus]